VSEERAPKALEDTAREPRRLGAMKKLFTTYTVLCCVSLGFAQGLQGNVTVSGKAAVQVTGHSVALSWNACPGATTYNVYRGAVNGGPYIQVGAGIVSTNYVDVQVTHNQTLYYVTTAVYGANESGYSNEAVAVIP